MIPRKQPTEILVNLDKMRTVADFTGTMRGPTKGADGKLIAPTNKKFHIEFCTHWKGGEIVEEKLFYDLVGLLKQIGVV